MVGGCWQGAGGSRGHWERKPSLHRGSWFLGFTARPRVGQDACFIPAWMSGRLREHVPMMTARGRCRGRGRAPGGGGGVGAGAGVGGLIFLLCALDSGF